MEMVHNGVSMPITMLLLILSMKLENFFSQALVTILSAVKDIGYGHTVNVPLEPYTEDASFLECFKLTVEPVIKSFKPDIILSVNGVDIHHRDPLTHLNCTLHSLYEIPYL